MTEEKKYTIPASEKAIVDFWERHDIFKKTLEQDAPNGTFTFYDGPPFATGTPHYGHIVGNCLKDVLPRYKTMRGFHVPRKWGWDCHGLPIENIVEKELGFTSKKDIVTFGIDRFNETCRSRVLQYTEEWKVVIKRLGRFIDMEHDYKTMDLPFMESVWWVFKQLWDKGFVYEGYKSMHICPRCETTLSQSEVADGYRTIKDLSVTAAFRVVDEPDTYFLAWTTTPWTLPGNVALAVNTRVPYARVTFENKHYIIAEALVEKIFSNKEGYAKTACDISDYIGKHYEPLFPYFLDKDMPNKERLYTIVDADFVSADDGTGIVHIAPAFGDDDMRVGTEQKLPFIQHVRMDGTMTDDVVDFSGRMVKPRDDHQSTDIEIVKYLAAHGTLFTKEKYEHSYPHCWRCETPLLNYAKSSWFVKVTEIKDILLRNNENTRWMPEHLQHGRSGDWLEGARDWAISRERFWASVMPVWRCDSCGHTVVVGSIIELESLSGRKIADLHKHIVDGVTMPCACGKEMHRIPEVLDTWFDSGSMPFAQSHYLGKPLPDFDPVAGVNFPADYIAEGVDQTRCWFYYLNVIASAITGKQSFKNVVVNGTMLAEDGQKMSKRLQNYPNPLTVIDTHGADALRLYLLSAPVVRAEDLNFSERGVDEKNKKVVRLLWNIFTFYDLFAADFTYDESKLKPAHILDRWMIAKVMTFINDVTEAMEDYDIMKAARPIDAIIAEFSTWYVRRSRDRFKGADAADKEQALLTTHYCLLAIAKTIAPFCPFIAEEIYQQLRGGKESVHLETWPAVAHEMMDSLVMRDMDTARRIVEQGLSLRAQSGIKIRQALGTLYCTSKTLSEEVLPVIQDELNVKKVEIVDFLPDRDGVVIKADEQVKIALDTVITPELELDGIARELIRHINSLRKDEGLSIGDTAQLQCVTDSAKVRAVLDSLKEDILSATALEEITLVADLPDGVPLAINDENLHVKLNH